MQAMEVSYTNKNQRLIDYYGPLLTQQIRTILQSGLLLDEDYEVLLKAAEFKIYTAKTIKVPLGLIASVLTTLGCVFVAKRYDLPFVILPPLTITLGMLYLDRKSKVKSKRYKEIANSLVQSLIKARKLNADIVRYVKLRNELSSSNDKEILLNNQNIKAFMELFLEKYQKYFKTCLRELKFIVNLTNELSEDFQVIRQIDIEAILVFDYLSLNDYLIMSLKVQDLFTFLSSKFLNYLALTFCKNLKNINAPELGFLLDKKLPSIKETLDKLYEAVHKEFNDLRYSTYKKLEIDMHKTPPNRHVSGKLQQTLVGSVNNLSIIMEKSRTVLQRVETAENENDVKKLESALLDLRDHALATYESLDILCKLYGIFSEANKEQNEIKTTVNSRTNSELNIDSRTVNYDDNSDALEENYELFIPKNETADENEERESYVDQSTVYLNLMLKELRQSLKQHDRFIAARDKRGIKDEDEESSTGKHNSTKENKLLPPKFDLSALQSKELSSEKTTMDLESNTNTLTPQDLIKSLPPLPPPPPPPPSFNLTNLKEEDESLSNRSLFDNIRTLSRQIQGNEDVFENENYSSDSN